MLFETPRFCSLTQARSAFDTRRLKAKQEEGYEEICNFLSGLSRDSTGKYCKQALEHFLLPRNRIFLHIFTSVIKICAVNIYMNVHLHTYMKELNELFEETVA